MNDFSDNSMQNSSLNPVSEIHGLSSLNISMASSDVGASTMSKTCMLLVRLPSGASVTPWYEDIMKRITIIN